MSSKEIREIEARLSEPTPEYADQSPDWMDLVHALRLYHELEDENEALRAQLGISPTSLPSEPDPFLARFQAQISARQDEYEGWAAHPVGQEEASAPLFQDVQALLEVAASAIELCDLYPQGGSEGPPAILSLRTALDSLSISLPELPASPAQEL